VPSSLADGGSSYIVDPSGDLSPTNMIVDDLNLSIVALQLHYRYEIAPLSNIYLVYSRGGTQNITGEVDSFSSLFTRLRQNAPCGSTAMNGERRPRRSPKGEAG